MKIIAMVSVLLYAILLFTMPLISFSSSTTHQNLLNCLALHSITPVLHTPNTTSYSSILQSSLQNLRFTTPTTPKPQFIITPSHESQLQAIVVCSRNHGMKIKVRSGGHDFEGLSYTSNDPFIMVDLVNLRSINVSIEDNTAWVQAGANLGEVYYRIADKSPVHGFPAGLCPTVGVGGHISGAGFGTMLRKYGVSADYVLDARVINVHGEILTRETMGEDLFWAIRGGGAASFGVVLAWKIKLVPVPPIVTVSMVDRTLEQGATELVHKLQSIASKLPHELYIGMRVTTAMINSTEGGDEHQRRKTVRVNFQVMYLGRAEKLMKLMEQNFHELGLKKKDCVEMSWIESVIIFAGLPDGTPVEALLNRTSMPKATFKGKSDFVKTPVPLSGLERIWKKLMEEERPEILISPWGGRMEEISDHEIAMPHRAENLYVINYNTYWDEEGESEKHISWIRELYDYMAAYVSKSPRAAFFNFKDLDLGQNGINGSSTYSEARHWGQKYFKRNFERLVQVKSKVDPGNFFSNEQSIPPVIGRKKH